MKQLGERNYALISQGVKTTGSYKPEECFFIFEEQLYVNEVDEIRAFMQWVSEDVPARGFGHGNYEQRFKEFKKSTIKFRAEVTGIKESNWSSNGITYNTVKEAEKWIDNLASRWFGFDMARVVSDETPKNEAVDFGNNIIYLNLRK